MIIRRITLALSFFIFFGSIHAQNATITEVDHVNFNHVSPIYSGNDVTGFYALVKSKKKNKGQETWSLSIFDQSLGLTKSIEILKPKETVAVQSVSNGSAICIMFTNGDDKTIECCVYDLTGSLTGTYQPILTEIEKTSLKSIGRGFDPAGRLMPIAGKGFIRVSVATTILDAIDNKGASLWKWQHVEKSDKIGSRISAFYPVNNLLFAYLSHAEKKESYWQLLMIDLETGKLKNTINYKSGDNYLTPFGIKYDELKKEYVAFGTYGVNNEPLDYYRKGIYFQHISEDGTVKDEKLIDWEKEVKSLIPEKSMPNTIAGAGTFFFDINIMPDGHIQLIGERFARKMNVSVGLSVTMVGSGGGGGDGPSATISMEVGGLFVFNFNSAMKLEKVEQAEKKTHDGIDNALDGTYAGMGPGLETNKFLAFDYLYMTGSSDAPRIVFLDIEKIKNKEATYQIKSEILEKEGSSSKKEIPVTSETGFFKVMQGAKGQVVIAEFFSKTNELTLKEIKAF